MRQATSPVPRCRSTAGNTCRGGLEGSKSNEKNLDGFELDQCATFPWEAVGRFCEIEQKICKSRRNLFAAMPASWARHRNRDATQYSQNRTWCQGGCS